ncbi:uncharacterized protein J3D65DRAFT_94156 [Phyllosticta citribraziliensis]|uniref:Secreted protein n=1 Tax=Phyllosticta citribraziliensis TaxID=989973 RepID=A0ABR1LA54_9PEZI
MGWVAPAIWLGLTLFAHHCSSWYNGVPLIMELKMMGRRKTQPCDAGKSSRPPPLSRASLSLIRLGCLRLTPVQRHGAYARTLRPATFHVRNHTTCLTVGAVGSIHLLFLSLDLRPLVDGPSLSLLEHHPEARPVTPRLPQLLASLVVLIWM